MLDALIGDANTFLYQKLLPKWLSHGIHSTGHYSAESLNHDWSVNHVNRLRLLTQCRQLYTFSHAFLDSQKTSFKAPLDDLFEFICDHYWHNGHWIFSLDDQLTIKDTQSDAYALAFVLLSFSYYFRVSQNPKALIYLEHTHHFLDAQMRHPEGGFLESLPAPASAIRRQNPHMHLLEGYIALYDTKPDAGYKAIIEELLTLFEQHFFESEKNNLIEFFVDDWKPCHDTGMKIEPGHHYEWVWLLHQAYRIIPEPRYLEFAKKLWDKANKVGWDPKGGIYNCVHGHDNSVIDAEKRIWPLTEYLKAYCVMNTKQANQQHLQLENALRFLLQNYLKADGSWNEYLDTTNQPKAFPLPGTSSYHIFLGITEVSRWWRY